MSLIDIRNKLNGYRYPDQAARDVQALISNFSSLKIQDAKDFVHSDGTTQKLVCVTGTIPVKIRGSTYNIPIAVWLKMNHPHYPPIVYVTPTYGMAIQPSQFVDANGMVYMPYLTEWNMGSSDLTALSQILCATFADHCPVYSRPTRPQWQPPRPVQPPTSYRSPSPYPSSYPPPQAQPPQPYPGYPAPYPAGGTRMPTPYSSYQQTPPTSSVTSGQPPPYPVGPPGQFPQQQRPPDLPPPSTASIAMAAAAGASITAEEERRQIEESERIKRQSLETAVEDKIRRHVTAVLNEAEKEMEALQKTQKGLLDGSRRINEMMEDMEKKEREVDNGIATLHDKNTELESLLEYLRAQPDDVNVDKAVSATTPLYEQILQLYAEENAIEDTIYYLGEALRKRVIEMEVFLKYVRELSRKQFMARATIMKARSTAGLPQYGHAL